MLHCIINHYCEYVNDIFVNIVNNNVILIQDKIMSVEYAAAMLKQSNYWRSSKYNIKYIFIDLPFS